MMTTTSTEHSEARSGGSVHTPAHGPRRTPARRRAAALTAAVGGAALGLSALTASPAWAHDELLSASPEAGEVLTEAPEEITLEFTGEGLTEGEHITNEIRVTDAEGESWETETIVEGASLRTALDGELPDGEYEVLYRVVYSDGHDEEDSYSFEVDLPEAADTDDAEEGTEGAAEEDSVDAPVDAETAAESDPATEEGQFPAWAPVLFAAGGVLFVVLAVVLMRRKMNAVEEWKQAPRQPRDTTGDRGRSADGGTSEAEGQENDDDGAGERPRDDS